MKPYENIFEKIVYKYKDGRFIPVNIIPVSCEHTLEHACWSHIPNDFGYIEYQVFECEECDKGVIKAYNKVIELKFQGVKYFANENGMIKEITSDSKGFERIKKNAMRKQVFSRVFEIAVEGGLISPEEAEKLEESTRKEG